MWACPGQCAEGIPLDTQAFSDGGCAQQNGVCVYRRSPNICQRTPLSHYFNHNIIIQNYISSKRLHRAYSTRVDILCLYGFHMCSDSWNWQNKSTCVSGLDHTAVDHYFMQSLGFKNAVIRLKEQSVQTLFIRRTFGGSTASGYRSASLSALLPLGYKLKRNKAVRSGCAQGWPGTRPPMEKVWEPLIYSNCRCLTNKICTRCLQGLLLLGIM